MLASKICEQRIAIAGVAFASKQHRYHHVCLMLFVIWGSLQLYFTDRIFTSSKKKRKKNLTLDPNQLKCRILHGYATKGLFVIYTFIIIHLLPQHGTIHGDFAKIWEQISLWLNQSRLPPLLKMLYVDWVSVDLNLTSRVFSGHSSFLPPQNWLPVYSIWLSP